MQKRYLKIILSAVMSAALFIGMAASCWHSDHSHIVAHASETESSLHIINLKEGTSSGYGQQSISYTDQNGKTVNLQDEAEKVSGISQEDVQAMMQRQPGPGQKSG